MAEAAEEDPRLEEEVEGTFWWITPCAWSLLCKSALLCFFIVLVNELMTSPNRNFIIYSPGFHLLSLVDLYLLDILHPIVGVMEDAVEVAEGDVVDVVDVMEVAVEDVEEEDGAEAE